MLRKWIIEELPGLTNLYTETMLTLMKFGIIWKYLIIDISKIIGNNKKKNVFLLIDAGRQENTEN